MKLKLIVTAAALALIPTRTHAQSVVDFEDIQTERCWSFSPGRAVVSRGFSFSGIGDGLFSCLPGVIGGNTSTALLNANGRSVLTMAAVDGAAFSLNAFFAGMRTGGPCSPACTILEPYYAADGITVVGNLVGGGSISQWVSLDTTAPFDFAEYLLPAGFTNLQSVVFTATGTSTAPEFLIDDIAASSVVATPEPSGASMLLIGLSALLLKRRRRQR